MRNGILIAGGAGFIGSALTRSLVRHGHPVTVLDDFSAGSRTNLDDVADTIETVECDAAQADALAAAVLRIQPAYVVSCIGDTYVPAAYHFPERFFRNNVDAHLNLLQACRQPGIRKLLYLSTAEVYASQEAPLHEGSPLGVSNTYAASKLAADQVMQTFAIEHGVPTLIARMFNCYGPRETHAYIVPELIDQFQRGPTAQIGDLRPVRDLTFVEDSADALRLLLFAPTPPGCVVNVGSGEAHDIGSLAERIGRLMGHQAVAICSDPDKVRRNEINVIRCDSRKLSDLTGWQPRVAIDDGLQQTIDWFQARDYRWPWRSHDEETSTHADVVRLHRA